MNCLQEALYEADRHLSVPFENELGLESQAQVLYYDFTGGDLASTLVGNPKCMPRCHVLVNPVATKLVANDSNYALAA